MENRYSNRGICHTVHWLHSKSCRQVNHEHAVISVFTSNRKIWFSLSLLIFGQLRASLCNPLQSILTGKLLLLCMLALTENTNLFQLMTNTLCSAKTNKDKNNKKSKGNNHEYFSLLIFDDMQNFRVHQLHNLDTRQWQVAQQKNLKKNSTSYYIQ